MANILARESDPGLSEMSENSDKSLYDNSIWEELNNVTLMHEIDKVMMTKIYEMNQVMWQWFMRLI